MSHLSHLSHLSQLRIRRDLCQDKMAKAHQQEPGDLRMVVAVVSQDSLAAVLEVRPVARKAPVNNLG
ncbi:hypothetical protein ES703_125180 [subsurface metagenome]